MHVLIQDGKVHELNVPSSLGKLFTVVDATSANPQPDIGWGYAGGTSFTPPVAPPANTRMATGYDLIQAMTDAQRTAYTSVKPWDQRLLTARLGPFPEDNPKIARIAAVIGTTSSAWFDALTAGLTE